MFLSVGSVHTRIISATDAELGWLTDYLSFDDANARYRPGGNAQRIVMINRIAGTFPSGFVPLVVKRGAQDGYKVELVDSRAAPATFDAGAKLEWLYDYQRAAVDAVCLKSRGILWLPTGAGKTEIATAITRALPCRWLFVVHRADLMVQTAERYEKRALEHDALSTEEESIYRLGGCAGRIGDGAWSIGPRFTCATFQTLSAGLERGDARVRTMLAETDGMIVDECHVLPSDSFWRVAMACSAYYRIGLSGTPLARGDRRSLLAIAATGPVIYRIKPDLLIARGVLARPSIRLLPVTQTSSKPSWAAVYSECIVRSPVRNAAVVAATLRAEKPCLVFVKEVAHGRILEKALSRAGLRVEFTFGTDSLEQRKRKIKSLVRGDLDALICSVIFQEGIDIPELRSVVNAGGMKTIIGTLQKLGRGMRVERNAAGTIIKDTFEAYDFADRGNRWLEKHARARQHAYAGEGYETVIEAESPTREAKRAP